jgi:hypothetical protein
MALSREQFIYLNNLIDVTQTVINNKEIYDEPWDNTDKSYLIQYVENMNKAFEERNVSNIINVSDELKKELLSIVKSEYGTRISYIYSDMNTIIRGNTFTVFNNLAHMLAEALDVKKLTPPDDSTDIVTYLNRFNNVHDYYYYGDMVRDFVGSLVCYAQFAFAMKEESAGNKLLEIANKCNRFGNKYIDKSNLYYLSAEANEIVDNLLRSF